MFVIKIKDYMKTILISHLYTKYIQMYILRMQNINIKKLYILTI